MRDVVIVDAVRSPVGKRNGGLSKKHSNELLGDVLRALMQRNGLSGHEVDQVVGGCVGQIGMQASNVVRNAWLTGGLPIQTPGVTVNVQCGSSQEALLLAHAQVLSGLSDVVVACGVESMTQIPIGSAARGELGFGMPRDGKYVDLYEPTTQFEAADRIAEKWGLSRSELEAFAKESQDRAARAWAENRFGGQIIPVDVDGNVVHRDDGLRETTLEGLARLKTNQPDRAPSPSRHTAGSSSQVSDGSSAALVMTAEKAEQLGLRPRARILDSVLVGTDPVLMLTGPIDATQALLARTGLSLEEIDLFEVNEAFASIVCAWAKQTGADLGRTNVNGGAIALGHPLGATGVVLLTKALYELERTNGRYALIAMCCGGGLGTGTVIERL